MGGFSGLGDPILSARREGGLAGWHLPRARPRIRPRCNFLNLYTYTRILPIAGALGGKHAELVICSRRRGYYRWIFAVLSCEFCVKGCFFVWNFFELMKSRVGSRFSFGYWVFLCAGVCDVSRENGCSKVAEPPSHVAGVPAHKKGPPKRSISSETLPALPRRGGRA
jgi:hypothetical protein